MQRSVLTVLKANPSTFLVCADFLLATVLDEVLNGRFHAGKDILDCLFSGDILNLSAAKFKLIGQISRIGVRNIGHHRFPNLAFDFEGWLVKAYLIEKSPFKGLIQIFSQVCGSDEDSVQILNEKGGFTVKWAKDSNATGYQVLSVKSEPYEKKGFSLFHKK